MTLTGLTPHLPLSLLYYTLNCVPFSSSKSFWTFVEDPDSFVFVSESNNVYHGRKEIAPFFDARAKTNLKTGKEDDAARKILLNFYGPGQHVLQTLSEIVRETALAEGLPKCGSRGYVTFTSSLSLLTSRLAKSLQDPHRLALWGRPQIHQNGRRCRRRCCQGHGRRIRQKDRSRCRRSRGRLP